VLRDTVSGAEIKTKQQQVCKAGDFLVAEIDAKVGGFGIVPPSLEGAIVSSHYFLFTVDETILDRRYLDYYIRTPAFRDQVTAQGSTNYAAIRPKDVLGYTISLPPLTEQRRIVARIEALAAKIEQARSLRQQAVEETEALLSSAGSLVFPPLVTTVGAVANVTKLAGFEYTEYFTHAAPGEVVVVRAGNVRDTGLSLSNAMTISKQISDALPRSQLLPNDVLMTFIGANIGDVTFVPQGYPRLHCGPNVAKISPTAEISHTFLVKALQSHVVQGQIEEITKSTAQPSLSMTTIRLLRIPLPRLPEQHRIVAYLDDLQAKVDALKRLQAQTSAQLDALLPSILDKAFKGELS
jgi:type I restriction enzyme S subunit